jgi:HTH-type transcriptional regulator / antitoxin HigA
MMDVKPLHNERDYDWAILEVSRYFESEPEPGTADGDRFEVLSTLIKAYEGEHFATKHGDPSTFCILRSNPWAGRKRNWPA